MSLADVRAIPSALRPRSRQAEMTPADLGMEDLDLEAAGPFSSNLIDLRDHFVYTLYIAVDDVSATSGDFSVFLDLYDREAETVVDAVEIANSVDAFNDSEVKVVFGEGVDTALETASGTPGTPAVGSRLANAKLNFLARLRLVNDTPADAASTVSLRLFVGD